ncbi:Dienelactone hydrolase [Paramicrobacterium humi]|uniref:Dienelactone hydrolase n=1 Tax=Paramicrobacterium humi TaxID=640635 RepID=A0A1H4T1J8_9MICO|nr:dienelactone hydrolase family protein [Microbacterium humi]SEC50149.1 Dienelactone hydrolase [Microbacterium humi]
MSEIVLFHHMLGRTDGVVAFADRLRERGHTVHVPDLFGGRRFDCIEAGIAYVQSEGFDTVAQRGVDLAEDLPANSVYAGFSFGVIPAQQLAQTRPGAAGALFLYSAVSPSAFGAGWPASVPVQIHAKDADPFFTDEGDIDAAREITAASDDGELFLYPGNEHLFAEAGHDHYDAAAAALALDRITAFLERLDSAH